MKQDDKRALPELELDARLLEQMIDDSNEMIQVSDAESFVMLYANANARQYSCHAGEPYKGRRCYEYMLGLDKPCPVCPMVAMGEDKVNSTEVDDGHGVYQVKIKRFTWEGRELFVEYASDITGNRYSLRLYKEQMESLIRSVPNAEGIFHLDVTADKVFSINGKSKNLPQIQADTIDEFFGLVTAFVVAPEDKEDYLATFSRQALLKANRMGLTELRRVYDCAYDDGTVRPSRIIGRLLHNPRNNHLECMVYGMDISEEKWREYEKNREIYAVRQENAEKTAFLRRMSHDIRTPLNGILGMIRMADKCWDDLDKIKECHRKILTSTDYLMSIINNILDIGKIEAGQVTLERKPFHLGYVLNNIVSLIDIHARNNGLQVIGGKSLSSIKHRNVIGSPVHLNRVLMNLGSNAIKYNRPGGSITLYCNELSCDGEKAIYELVCQDTGTGMSPGFQKQAFELYAREGKHSMTSISGSGIGLSIVKEILEMMHGTIEVQSQENVGTTFRVVVPLELDKDWETRAHGEAPTAQTDAAGCTALLVEDNELNMEISRALLEERGFYVLTAANGQEAVDAFAEAQPGTVDCIFMDVMMPVMDGLKAARKLRSLNRTDAASVPIIAMTANAFDEDKRACLEAGMNAHIGKPIQLEVLDSVIQQLLPQTRKSKNI